MMGDDPLIAEVTAGMEVVAIPSSSDILDTEDSMKLESINLMTFDNDTTEVSRSTDASSSVPSQQQQSPTLVSRRPFDVLQEAGPAAHPIPFSHPVITRGRRDDVLCYNEHTKKHTICKNVLFRDYEGDDSQVEKAYYKIPFKEPIKTIMGHVDICVVLERCMAEHDDDDDSSEQEDDDDIVFTLSNQYVAVKVNYYDKMEEHRNKHAENPLTEIAAMQLIGDHHPNVVECLDVLFDGKNLNVVMPYCGCDLFQLLQDTQNLNSHTPGLTEPQARYWFRQIMHGLQFLHGEVGICHRDLSPENIMIDGNGCVIIDMGMAIRIPFTDPKNPKLVTDAKQGSQRRLIKPQGTCGKLPYMSPEVYRNRQDFDGVVVDVWTAGTILFCMLTGNRSYGKPSPSDPQFYWMTNGLNALLEDWGVQLSPEGVDLLKGMLQVDPRLRLTTEEVLKHPWFRHADEPMLGRGQPSFVV